uniref:Uncharacterized protein n=2 Tax=Timema TaxID=61471 RepID=A0A7R9AVF8_TIMSH|nr:unnamed protein product [Timema shepardi]CAD7572278.1 unnamed protein product [Timema californicum]
MEYQEKLKVLDEELMSFYQYCQQVGFSEAEMDVICAPLVSSLRKSFFKKVIKYIIIVLTFVAFAYGLCQVDSVSLHFSAVGRLLMIKLLPFWDWTAMFYESCLVSNPFYGEYQLTEEDCVQTNQPRSLGVILSDSGLHGLGRPPAHQYLGLEGYRLSPEYRGSETV